MIAVWYRYEVLGGHVHVAVRVGPDVDHLATAGTLVFRAEEWAAFERGDVEASYVDDSATDVQRHSGQPHPKDPS